MVQAVDGTKNRAAWLLERADRDWRWLVELLAEWESLDDYEQLTHASEVPLYVDRLLQLQTLGAKGSLSSEELSQLAEVLTRAHDLRPQLLEHTGYDLPPRLLTD